MSVIKPDQPLALRVLRFPLTLLVLGFVAFSVLYLATAIIGGRPEILHRSPLQPLVILAGCALTIWLYKLFQRRVELRDDVEFAFAGAGTELAQGLGIGFAVFSAAALTAVLAGGMQIEGLRGGIGNLWGMLSMAIISGLFEELLFRGIAFRQLENLLGTWAALALTSAFFGLAHIGNPDATWFAAFAIAVEAGILLGAAYMVTRRLWLAAGIHAAWNFTQGWVFSVPVSGGDAPEGLLRTSFSGPVWLNGGAFGLEASVPALVVATLAGLYLLRVGIIRHGLIAPLWQRKLGQTTGETE
ncbi:CPBP family intramembrane glutamic endopeptidase [Novosphingobium sp. B 225]|uniref:CPBP family intramembrane glutamic endopeptidase n=1 Tax=Novosphingobium sp. B 225 TaxID=1961849 RepID=UPI000B4A9176|nr:type II CAAX endopeptidase family protein [Novosphingobium sp. B 225]